MQVMPEQHWPMLHIQLSGGLQVTVAGAYASVGQPLSKPLQRSATSHIGLRAARQT
jgi:hypothetical protein